MKFLERLSLVLFSNIILILSILLCLILFGWVDASTFTWIIGMALNHTVATNVTLGVCIVLILLSIKCIFFGSAGQEEEEENLENGILLENEDGRLLITKETIRNIALNVIDNFDGALNPKVELEMDKQNHVKMNVIITAKELTAINQLSKNIQLKVKETIKKTTDLELSAVNVAIRNERLKTKEEEKEDVEA